MAIIAVQSAGGRRSESPLTFAAVWAHYRESGFLYPEKRDRLGRALEAIRAGWPVLLDAPAELFQLHVVQRGDEILSSLGVVRDTEETCVVQHAVSRRYPPGMIATLDSVLTTLGSDPTVRYLRMSFRPENRGPSRWVRLGTNALGPKLTAVTLHEYLAPRASAVPFGLHTSPKTGIMEADASEAVKLVIAAAGPVRAAALGLQRESLDLAAVDAWFAPVGVRRWRQVIGVRRDGALAGLAICFASSIPLNFSMLCNRTELLIHPDAPDRANVVRELASAASTKGPRSGEWLRPLLVAPDDSPAALEAGYVATGKRYTTAVWARENATGWTSAKVALDRLYERKLGARAGGGAEAY